LIRVPRAEQGEEGAVVGVVPTELGWPPPRPPSTAERSREGREATREKVGDYDVK